MRCSRLKNRLTWTPRGVQSFTGGGGKTSLIFHLARLLVPSGNKVMTTTNIFLPTIDQSETVLVDSDTDKIMQQAVNLIVNASYRLCLNSSLKAGLQALSDDLGAVLFLLRDQPFLSPGTYRPYPGRLYSISHPIVLPVSAGCRGNPVFFRAGSLSRTSKPSAMIAGQAHCSRRMPNAFSIYL